MEIDGALLIDKPAGWTSHDVVDFVRRRLGIKKAGHAGTLDPMATGLLIILLGKATRLSPAFLNGDKTYEARLTLGSSTDTADAEGRVIESRGLDGVDETAVRRVMENFRGEIKQTPPMYSAKKVNGKSLYKLARRGITVEREPRTVFIRRLEINAIDLPDADFTVVCSKGTYIRQLCADIGERLGCGGHMSRLRRTGSGRLGLEGAVEPDGLIDAARRGIGSLTGLRSFIPIDALKGMAETA